jgi:hypothetical protein
VFDEAQAQLKANREAAKKKKAQPVVVPKNKTAGSGVPAKPTPKNTAVPPASAKQPAKP